MDEQVPKEVVQERFERLVALQERISLERMREQVGSTAEVLVEGEGRKGRAQGRTRTNRVVHLDGDHAQGDFVDVRIVGAHPHHLDGEPVLEPVAVA
jgi:tRNA-2-methylthio-N6-dimethylallyladenosine synthase